MRPCLFSLSKVFEVQDDVACKITDALKFEASHKPRNSANVNV